MFLCFDPPKTMYFTRFCGLAQPENMAFYKVSLPCETPSFRIERKDSDSSMPLTIILQPLCPKRCFPPSDSPQFSNQPSSAIISHQSTASCKICKAKAKPIHQLSAVKPKPISHQLSAVKPKPKTFSNAFPCSATFAFGYQFLQGVIDPVLAQLKTQFRPPIGAP